MPKFSHVLFGRGEKNKQVSTLTPKQQEIQNQLENAYSDRGAGGAFGETSDYWRDLLSNDPTIMERMSAPSMQQYQQNTNDLSTQYAGLGLTNKDFQTGSQHGAESLNERLKAYRAHLRTSGAQGLTNMANFALRPTVENIHNPETSGIFESFAKGVGSAVTHGAGNYATNGGGIGGNRGGGGNYNYTNQSSNPYNNPYAATANQTAWR